MPTTVVHVRERQRRFSSSRGDLLCKTILRREGGEEKKKKLCPATRKFVEVVAGTRFSRGGKREERGYPRAARFRDTPPVTSHAKVESFPRDYESQKFPQWMDYSPIVSSACE